MLCESVEKVENVENITVQPACNCRQIFEHQSEQPRKLPTLLGPSAPSYMTPFACVVPETFLSVRGLGTSRTPETYWPVPSFKGQSYPKGYDASIGS
jgi:hypothetical protein